MPGTVQADIRVFDFALMEWITRTVSVPSAPKRRTARRTAHRTARPANRAGLSDGSPFAYGMADTAFAPGEPLADMRTYIKEPAITTHRAAVVVPAGRASDASAGTRWHDL